MQKNSANKLEPKNTCIPMIQGELQFESLRFM